MSDILNSGVFDGLSEEERAIALKILNEYKDNGQSNTLTEIYEEDYEEIPVDIDTFIEDDRYIGSFTGNGSLIYNYWRRKLRELFRDPNQYQEVANTGSIGTGKSTVGCVCMSYMLYRVMCLRDPQKYFRLAAGSTIVFAFINNTLDLSSSVGYGTVQAIIQSSPWFLERGKITGTKYKEYTPDKLIRFKVGSNAGHILGMNVFCALLDEVNFKNGANVQMEKSKIMETYNGVLERMGSRFMVNGKIAGKLFIISSKKSEYDFLESYIRKKSSDPSVFVCDAKLWEVKPTGTYSGKMFNVAIGGKNLQSRILDDNEDIETLRKQGYEILEVPVEFKERFRMDIQAALMNIAGISISEVTKFIPYPNLAESYGKDKNPFTAQILTIGTKDNYSISDYFRPELVNDVVRAKPIYIHIDGSLTGDRTGISGVAIMGIKEEIRYINDEFTPIQELVYKHIFSIGIQCPPGAEISLQKNREFVYYLKYNLGFNICGISLDGFQSADSKQQFLQAGFDARILSLDRTPDGYMYLKASINEKRIQMLNIPILETELINLEQNNMTGKVDHNPENSKDISDSVAGALWNASQISEEDKASLHVLDDFSSFSEVNDKSLSSELRDSVLENMQNDLLGISNPTPSNYEDVIGEMSNEVERRSDRIKKLRATLTPQENFRVSDDELESAFYNQDDDFLVW